jgi:hypothetical protein
VDTVPPPSKVDKKIETVSETLETNSILTELMA